MSLGKAQICGIWALGALTIAVNGARAQQSAPAAASAAQPAIAASASAANQSSWQSPAQMVRTSEATSSPASPPTVCFKLTMRCFGNTPASAEAAQASGKSDSNAAKVGDHASSLNLTPPDVRTVIPQEELAEPLPTEDQQEQQADTATVEVQSDPDTPNVPGGFGALFWALRHPTQAWRIFTPVE